MTANRLNKSGLREEPKGPRNGLAVEAENVGPYVLGERRESGHREVDRAGGSHGRNAYNRADAALSRRVQRTGF